MAIGAEVIKIICILHIQIIKGVEIILKKKNVLIVTSVLLVVIGAISWFILSDKKAETDSDTKVTTTEINAAVTQNITEKETLPEVTETETEPETLSEPEHEIGFEHETTPIEMSDEALKVLGDDSEKAKEMITEIVISYYYDSVEKVKLLAVKPSEKNADEMILSYKAVREVDRYFDIIYNTKTKKLRYVLW